MTENHRPRGRLSRRDLLGLGALALAALPGRAGAAPAPGAKPASGGVVVLDDCDPDYSGKPSYADNLSWIDGAGKVQARVSGLNICQEIGSPHRVAIDHKQGRVWVAETVGYRLLQHDLKGKQLLTLPGVKASSLAVDPASGTVWVARTEGSIGSGFLEVYDVKGTRLGRHDLRVYDIAYDPKGKAMWLAERSLIKASLTGKVLMSRDITTWCAISIDVDPRNGNVWVLTRHHSGTLGRNALLGFDNNGNPRADIDLAGHTPFRVAIDPRDGAVWVALYGTEVRRYSPDAKVEARYPLKPISLTTDSQGGHVWVATGEEVLKVDRAGKVLQRTAHKGKTTQAWMAGL